MEALPSSVSGPPTERQESLPMVRRPIYSISNSKSKKVQFSAYNILVESGILMNI